MPLRKWYPDEYDSDITWMLHNNGAMNAVDLRRYIGREDMNPGVFKKSHLDFLNDGFIKRYTIIPDILMYGYECVVMFNVKIDSHRNVTPTSTYILRKIERVMNAFELSDEYQIQFTVVAKDYLELLEYYIPAVENIPNLVDYKWSRVVRVTEELGYIPPRQDLLYENFKGDRFAKKRQIELQERIKRIKEMQTSISKGYFIK